MKALFKNIVWCIALAVGTLQSVSQTRDIIAATHTQGLLGDSISFRFTAGSEPIINYLPTPDDYLSEEEITDPDFSAQTKKRFVFFMPYARVKNSTAQKFITQMNNTVNQSYKISLTPTTSPMPGLRLEVETTPAESGFQLETFMSTKGEPGIKCTFHDKKALGLAVAQADSILKTAYVDASSNKVKKKYA